MAVDDERLADLRRVCGEDEWAEAGFVFGQGVVYGVERNGQLVAAGNMTPYRGALADVGLLTRPDHRGQGVARALASRMIADVLPEAGLVRYRSSTANAPSLAVARALGFVGPRRESAGPTSSSRWMTGDRRACTPEAWCGAGRW